MQHTLPNTVVSRLVGLLVIMVVALCLACAPGVAPSAHAVTAAEKQAEAEEALARLNSMQETLDIAAAEYGEAIAAQEAAEKAVVDAKARLVEINKQLDVLQTTLNARARDMYRNGGTTFIEMLLGASTFQEFATSWDMLNKVGENDAQLVSQQKALRIEAEGQEALLEEQAAIAAQKSEEAAAVEAQAQATVAEMQAIYDSLSEEAAALLEEERRAEEEAERARMQAVIEAAAAAAGDDGGSYDFSNDDVLTETVAYEGGNDTVSRAYACMGAPYVWGGVGPYGYDCSGLVSYCLSGSHIRLGTTYTFMDWPQVSDPQPGDIAVNWSHTGVYIGGGQMIHAATYGVGVIIGPVQSGMIIVRYPG